MGKGANDPLGLHDLQRHQHWAVLGALTLKNGMISAAFLWLGFVITTLAVNNTFGMPNFKLVLIDGRHRSVTLLLMGAVIGP